MPTSLPVVLPAPVARPVLLGCPDCGNSRLLLRVETPIPITVIHHGDDPFDPDGCTVSRVEHTPFPALKPRPMGVQCTGCGWSTPAPNFVDHLTPAGL